jgi:hypothetical protein
MNQAIPELDRGIYIEEVDPSEPIETSPLQEYIDQLPPVSDEELNAIAERIRNGDSAAISEIIDRSLPVIRDTVRALNEDLRLDQDELIGIVVEAMLRSPNTLVKLGDYRYIPHMLPRIIKFTERSVSLALPKYTAHIELSDGTLETIIDSKGNGADTAIAMIGARPIDGTADLDDNLPDTPQEGEAELEAVISRLSAKEEVEELVNYHGSLARSSKALADNLEARRKNLGITLYKLGSEKTNLEIAKELGISRGRVSQRVQKCLHELQKADTAIHGHSPEEKDDPLLFW